MFVRQNEITGQLFVELGSFFNWAISLKSFLFRVIASFLFRTAKRAAICKLSVLRSAFSESDDHYLKHVNLRFVHSTTITYEQLELERGGLVFYKFGAECFALHCFHFS